MIFSIGQTHDPTLIEITRGGVEPVELSSGETRSFLEDGDEVILSARARRDSFVQIGFGDCSAVVQLATT